MSKEVPPPSRLSIGQGPADPWRGRRPIGCGLRGAAAGRERPGAGGPQVAGGAGTACSSARPGPSDFKVGWQSRRAAPRLRGAGLPSLGHEEPQVPPEETGRARPPAVRRRHWCGESRRPAAPPRVLPALKRTLLPWLSLSTTSPSARRLLRLQAGPPRWLWDPGGPFRSSSQVSELLALRDQIALFPQSGVSGWPPPRPFFGDARGLPGAPRALSPPGSAGFLAGTPRSRAVRAPNVGGPGCGLAPAARAPHLL